DGTVRSGASSLFTLPLNGTFSVTDIGFQSPPPIPTSLTISAPVTSLGAQGQTVQLAVTATYADGSTADVTPATAGTDYRTSNAAIATVDSGGLVTAQSSGVVIVSAASEGALAVVQLQVVLSGSSVGDGIPDDWKIAHGLDPHDPLLAYEDPDHDGLTNLEEFQNGTDPNNPDTDGDGLSDGDEVHVYHTNPLLWDTDGDGISDGVEVQTGSNPLDIHSFNLAAALSAITVSPAALQMTFNTVSGEASRQLQAVGNVIDGRTIDMFNPLYSTQIASSDLTVASFGGAAGQVFAGQSGTATITVSNSGHAGTASVTVQTFSPTALGFVAIPGFQNAVEVAGSYAFLASGAAGLNVVDVTNLAQPVLAAQLATLVSANDVRISGSVAYVADDSGLLLVDVTDPAHPARLGSLLFPGGRQVRLAVGGGGLVYLADLTFGLRVVNASNPMQPIAVGSLALPGTPRAVSLGGTGLGGFGLTGSYAVVACGDGGVAVVDVSDPTAPREVGSTPPDQPRAGSVTVRGHYAYVAAGEAAIYGGLHVVELVDPTNPVEVGASVDNLGVTRVALEDGFALGAQFFLAGQVAIFDIGSLPPVYATVLDQTAVGGAPRGNDVVVRNGAVFVAANGELADFAASSYYLNGLVTGLFELPVAGDTTPPAVSIISPVAGATVLERLPVTVGVTAQDQVSVDSVSFLVNGTIVDTLYKPPFQVLAPVPSGQPTVTLGAVATNISGVQASTQEILNVQPYPLPVATLLAPVAGQTVVAGTTLTIAATASDAVAVTQVSLYVNGQLVTTLTAPPYLQQIVTPPAPATLTVTAVAYDALGAGNPSAPATVTVVPDVPPTAAVFSPVDGAQVVEGIEIPVVAGANDASGIASVHLFLNGSDVGAESAAPYTFDFQSPPAGQTTLIHVVAIDGTGLQTATPDLTVTSIADPGTAVSGFVVDPSGAPVAGATVTVTAQGGGAATASSGADGSFAVAGLPTNQGSLEISASGTLGGCPAQASTTVAPPPAGQNVFAGNLVLAPTANAVAQTTTVTGSVLGTDGQGLAGVTVTVSSADLADTATVVSGAGGVFTVAGFPARAWPLQFEATITVGGVVLYGIDHPGIVPFAGGTTSLGSLALQPYPYGGPDALTTVTGQVNNADGSPAAGAEVVIDFGYAQLVTTTAGDGTFAVTGVPTLQGGIQVAGSLHLPCGALDSTGIVNVAPLNPGDVTAVGVLTLIPDTGPLRF
ncbi:MAG TPA: Ig-like domain-containing protein, partial [Thermoanaerobaculia bacterium]|nr:Ig-like domain-containing protein [Thermoanaerobaculia bacterium]